MPPMEELGGVELELLTHPGREHRLELSCFKRRSDLRALVRSVNIA
jgi:hypothetical protein